MCFEFKLQFHQNKINKITLMCLRSSRENEARKNQGWEKMFLFLAKHIPSYGQATKAGRGAHASEETAAIRRKQALVQQHSHILCLLPSSSVPFNRLSKACISIYAFHLAIWSTQRNHSLLLFPLLAISSLLYHSISTQIY
jgi:hypothetical protein